MKASGQVLSVKRQTTGKSTKQSRKTSRTLLRQKNLTAHGGCLLLISCFNSTKSQWVKYSHRTGKSTQLRVNGQARPMEDAALSLYKKVERLNKASKTSTFSLRAMIDGSTTLNSESKLIKTQKYTSAWCFKMKISAPKHMFLVGLWLLPVNQKPKGSGSAPQKLISLLK